MSRAPELRIYPHSDEVARGAAALFISVGGEAIRARGSMFVALSGGSTPKLFHAALTGADYAAQLDWQRVSFFFGDERAVPPDHAESNYGMAKATLFQPLGIKPEQVYRIQGEELPEVAARHYEEELRRILGTGGLSWPSLDLVLLGMGEDGHTASLFPDTPAVQEQTRWVTTSVSPQGVRQRISLTLGVLNHADVVVFLVTGRNKARTVKAILEPAAGDTRVLPAALVRPVKGRLMWLLDDAAASELTVARQSRSSREE